MKLRRGLLIAGGAILACQLLLAYLLGLGYVPRVQVGTATSAAQVNRDVLRVRDLQARLAQQIAAELKVPASAVTHTVTSGNQNNLLGTLSACPVGSGLYTDQDIFPYPANLTSLEPTTRAGVTARAVERAVSKLLPQLGDYSINDPARPTTIAVPVLHAQVIVLTGESVQVTAAISDPATGNIRCFPLDELPAARAVPPAGPQTFRPLPTPVSTGGAR